MEAFIDMEDQNIEIRECLCCWYDLLGYGTPFVNSKWDLHNDECRKNYSRIERLRLQFTSSWSVKPLGTKLAFNDGFASTIDINPITPETFHDALLFLEGIITDYGSLNSEDKREGFPGARGIITLGQRFSYDCCNSSYDLLSNRTTSYHPVEFQMNTAFSKAFLMEESGSRAGITGSNLYIDIEVFHYIAKAAREIGCQTPQIKTVGDELMVKIFAPGGWFADLEFECVPILYKESLEYKNRGIETMLYRFKHMHSIIDDWSKEVAYQEARPYSIMDSLADEDTV